MAGIDFAIRADNGSFIQKINESKSIIRSFESQVQQSGISIEDMFKRISNVAAVSFAGFSAKQFISEVANVRGEFQKLEVAFNTMLGSKERADALMAQIVHTAAITPFGLQDVAGGAKQLLAYGVAAEEVNDKLIKLGDIAAGLSLPLNDLIYLYGTTMTQGRMFTQDLRQFQGRGIPLADEIAKQFGVAKEKVGELVTAGKVGAKEFNEAIMSMASPGGQFAGLMENQSKTITGQIANIEDAIEVMFNDIGQANEGIINDSLDVVSRIVENWRAVGEAIMVAISAVGVYKTAVLTVSAFQGVTATVGYEAEAAELAKLLPLKEANTNADIKAALSSGRITEAQAAKIAAYRGEAAALQEKLRMAVAEAAAETASAKAAYKAALQRSLASKQAVRAREAELKIALQQPGVEAVTNAQKNLSAAIDERSAAVKARKVASQELELAKSRQAVAVNAAEAASQQIQTAATEGQIASTNLLTIAKTKLAAASKALGLSMLANPYVLVTAAIVGLGYGVYKLATAETAAERATRKHQEAQEEFKKTIEDRKSRVDELLRTIQDETQTEVAQIKAYEELKQIMPALTDEYDRVALKALDLTDAQKTTNKALSEAEYQHAIDEVNKYQQALENAQSWQKNLPENAGGWVVLQAAKDTDSARTSLELAQEALIKLIRLRRQAEEEAKPIEIKIKEAEENEAVAQKIFDFYDRATRYAENLSSPNGPLTAEGARMQWDEFVNEVDNQVEELRKKAKLNPLKFNAELQRMEQLQYDIQSMKQQWATSGLLTIPMTLAVNAANAGEQLAEAKAKVEGAKKGAKALTYKEELAKRRREYESAIREEIAAQNKSAEEWEKAHEKREEAEKAYKEYGGDTVSKARQKAEKQQEAERKRIDAEEKLNEELIRLRLDNQRSEIALMEEGREKRLAQIDADYEAQKAEIIKKAAELVKTNKKAKAKVSDSDGLTDEQRVEITKAKDANESARNKALGEIAKEDIQSLRDYLKEYGTFQQQKLAIAEEYAEKIRKAQNEGERLILKKQLEEALKGTQTLNISFDIDWSQTFSGIGNVLKDLATETLKQIQSFMKTTEFKKLSATDKKAYQDYAEKLRSSGAGEATSPFNFKIWDEVAKDTERYQKAVKASKHAHELYNDATDRVIKAQEAVNNAKTEEEKLTAQLNLNLAKTILSQTSADVDSADTEKDNSYNSLSDSSSRAINGLNNFANALSTMSNGSLSGFANGVASIISSLKGGDEKLDGLLGLLGEKVGGIIGAILQILDALGDDPAAFIDEILGGVASAVEHLMEDLPKVIERIVAGAWDIVGGFLQGLGTAVGGLFGIHGGASDKGLTGALDRLGDQNEMLTNAIKRLTETMEKGSVAESTDYYKRMSDANKLKEENDLELLKRAANNKHRTWLGHVDKASTSYKLEQYLSADELKSVEQLLGTSIKKVGDLWNLNAEQWLNIANELPEIYQEIILHGNEGYTDISELLQNVVETAEEAQELKDALNEKLTDISFDSVRDNFRNTLLDMEGDFTEAFDDMAKNAAVQILMDNYTKRLQDWYENFADAVKSDSKLDEKENEELRNQYIAISEDAKAERDALFASMGWDMSSSSLTQQQASGGYQTSLSEDTGTEIKGLLTACHFELVKSNEGSSAMSEMIISTVNALSQLTTATTTNNNVLQSILLQHVTTNEHLADIAKYNKMMLEYGDKLDRLIKNTDRL